MGKTVCRIALLGLGTVGSGVVQTLEKHAQQLYLRTGLQLEIGHILVRNLQKDRGFATSHLPLTDSVHVLEADPDIQIVVEVMGGIEPAKTVIENSLKRGRHVITANKELMAKHGRELIELARQNGVRILYEASVAGGIPIIHTLQGYLQINRVHSIAGILNGTCNYILTQMSKCGREYQDALREAQAKGFAEADPASDVEGYDAAYKLAILSALAFGIDIPVERIFRAGIQSINATDIRLAREMGYVIKLIGQADYDGHSVALQVSPQLLHFDHPLARVDDVFNAVTIQTDVVGELTFIGRGAGQFPTASAVVEDIIAVLTTESRHQQNTISTQECVVTSPLPCTEFYLRLSSTSLDGLERVRVLLRREFQQSNCRVLDYKREHERIYTHAYRMAGINGEAVRNLIHTLYLQTDCPLDVNVLPIHHTNEQRLSGVVEQQQIVNF